MSIFYEQTVIFRFLKIAELWGQETNTDMWTIARIMAAGTQSRPNENPLIIHHISMFDAAGNHNPTGSFRNPKLVNALNVLIDDAPDHPKQVIVDGLHDMCISKEYFRLWCLEKYPLPNFWFSKKERTTFTEAEKVQIERVKKLSIEDLKNESNLIDVFEFKPSFQGFRVDMKKLFEHFKKKKGI
jgi:hypothetical protein